MKNSRSTVGGERRVEVEVRIAKDYVVTLENNYFNAGVDGNNILSAKCNPRSTSLGGYGVSFSKRSFPGKASFADQYSKKCGSDYGECAEEYPYTVQPGRLSLTSIDGVTTTQPYSEGPGLVMMSYHPYGSGSQYRRGMQTVACAAWRYPGLGDPCPLLKDRAGSTVCDVP